MPVYFKAKNSSFRVATKLARWAGLESARVLAVARNGIRAQTPIQRHTGGTPGNIYLSGCLMCGKPKWVKYVYTNDSECAQPLGSQ